MELEGLVGFKVGFESYFLGFEDILNDILLKVFLGFSKDGKACLVKKKGCFFEGSYLDDAKIEDEYAILELTRR